MTHHFNQTTPVPLVMPEPVCSVVHQSCLGTTSHLEKQAPAKPWWEPPARVEMSDAQTVPRPSGFEGCTAQGLPVPHSFSISAKMAKS